MYTDLLPFLVCTRCRGALRIAEQQASVGDALLEASLACDGCGAVYRVRSGVLDMAPFRRARTPAQFVNLLWPTAWAYERIWRPFALSLLSRERFPYERELALVTEMSGVRSGGLILDIACSNGLYARACARQTDGAGGVIVGVDHAWPMVVEAERRARAEGLRISYVHASAQMLPFTDGAATAVLIGGSLNEIGDLTGCLHELARVVSPSGRFIAMTLTRAATRAGQLLQRLLGSGGIVFWTPLDLGAEFARAGWSIVEQLQYGLVLFTRAQWQPDAFVRE